MGKAFNNGNQNVFIGHPFSEISPWITPQVIAPDTNVFFNDLAPSSHEPPNHSIHATPKTANNVL